MPITLLTCPSSDDPYPLYQITGNTAILPPGETSLDTYADMDALLAANEPDYVGQRIQVAIGDQVDLYEANYVDNAWVWVLVPVGSIVVAPLTLSVDNVAGGQVYGM